MRIRQRKIDAKAFLSLLKKMLLGIFGERSDLGKPKVLRGSAVEKNGVVYKAKSSGTAEW